MKKTCVAVIVSSLALCFSLARAADEPVVFKTAAASGENAAETGKKAATELKAAFGSAAPKAVLVMDSFEDVASKKAMLDGVASVLPKEILFGGASYGGFTQRGSVNDDGVVLLGIGGDGVGVEAALAENMGAAGLTMEKDLEKLTAALNRAGEKLAKQLPLDRGALMLLISDAHSPKNQLLLDGVQKVAGKKLPITGGSVNKNAGQNWVYFRGAAHTDSAIALLLTGPFKVTQTGRQAKTNEAVIETAREGSASVLKSAPAKPFAVIAFNCGGRKGKLKRLEDELEAIQTSVGKDLPLFGTYCAGEYGPADLSESKGDCTPCGRGWHVMFTVLAR
ncbi:MAG: FIST C-terminal domain-containing protein [Verrucomicrobia bacterium]|nr:FIST C-terminal domain-containing protein [Verrucomicrobiota bacterium]